MAERLRLYWPLRPHFVNQHFGDNIPCVRFFGTPQQVVVDGTDNFTCPVGYEKLYSKFGMRGHNGCDLRAGEQNLYAAAAGVVVEKQIVPARGLGLGILTDGRVDLDDAGEHFAKVRYWHLKTMYVEVGDHVEAGQLIGVTDNTGYSSGNHLHFEVQPFEKDAGGHPILYPYGSGIVGAIDPEPFFVGEYADTIPQKISLLQKMIPLLQALIQALKNKNESSHPS